MPKRLRVFISSPADVPGERLRADLIVDKLSQDYSRFFTIESYRWEHEAMLASKHFQDAIEPPSAFDIVVLILWSRLGTLLPEKTAEREYHGIDGRAPVTGTEWEYEEALKVAREKNAPDLLAFRNISPATIDPRDPRAQSESIAQFNALNRFWSRHFADRGVFLSAYDEYRTLEEFAARLEQSLRKLIERRLNDDAVGERRGEAIWLGDPFRGLESYECQHAAIFFGRDAAVMKATEQLAANAGAGSAFLLVSGASGSGKSSLAKAGIVPRLMKPQRISGAAFLRRVIFRPGITGGDVIEEFAKSLSDTSEPDIGLPELIAPGQDVAQLARHLRSAAGEPGYLFANALGRLTEAGRMQGRVLAFEQAKLIVVVDQLEELFTVGRISPDDRQLFIKLLAGLARSSVIWVIATLRADFWHRAAEIPEMIALAENLGRIDLAPASSAELAEMIRKPARMAGLTFEISLNTGLGLDVVLSEHATAAPGALPLLSFTLDELHQKAKASASATLTHASYEELGGLEGAIASRADQIVDALPAPAQAALPHVLRTLTTVSGLGDQVPVARAAPLARFAPESAARALIDAFIAGRLLVAASEAGAGATVRLAHEALISRWKRARDQLAADRRDLETRLLIEQQFRRWHDTSGVGRSRLLLRNPDLANAADLAHRWGDELDAPTREFIRQSSRRARVLQTLSGIAAVLFALVAGAAVYAERQANRASDFATQSADDARSQRDIAEREKIEATEQADRSNARAELIQSQLTMMDAPFDALGRALGAAQKLDSLKAGDEAVPVLRNVLNAVREVPLKQPYGHYDLDSARVIARQAPPEWQNDTNNNPGGLLTVVGTYDLTGVIDDEGRAVSPPLGSGEVDRSYANDAAWLDKDHFILATGAWMGSTTQTYTLRNAALRVFQADGKLSEEYLSSHSAPVRSVTVAEIDGQNRIILAGDSDGNLIVRPASGKISIIPTGVVAPIKKIVAFMDDNKLVLALIFGPPEEEHGSKTPGGNSLNPKDQKAKIAAALPSPAEITYFGDNPTDDIGCALATDQDIFICNRNAIVAITPWSDLKTDYSFTAGEAPVVSVAQSPISPILATASRDGQVRLWLNKGKLLAELSTDGGAVGSLGFIHNGKTLIDGRYAWDVSDLAAEIANKPEDNNENWHIHEMKRRTWASFRDKDGGLQSADLRNLIEGDSFKDADLIAHRHFVLAADSSRLRVIDTGSMTVREVDLSNFAPPNRKNNDTEMKIVTSENSPTLCVQYGAHLIAVDEDSGTAISDWPMPDAPKVYYSNPILSIHNTKRGTTCWVGSGQAISIYDPKDKSQRQFAVTLPEEASITNLLPLENSTLFLINGYSRISSSASTLMVVDDTAENAAGADAQSAPAIIASTKIKSPLGRITANADGSRIAVSVQTVPNHSELEPEIRIFDRNLNTIMSLPGIPDTFDELKLNSEGTRLRGISSDIDYEQDLRLEPRVALAKSRLAAWSDAENRETLYTKGVNDNDFEESKVILREAIARHPSDSISMLVLANREFFTAKTPEDVNRALNLYNQAASLDPFDPNIHYMRGNALAYLGDNKKALDDITAAIALPHVLAVPPVIAGFIGAAWAAQDVSFQANWVYKASYHLKRAQISTNLADWKAVIGDIAWIRDNRKVLPTLAYEVEAVALDHVDNASAAVESYKSATDAMQHQQYYGLDEFNDRMKQQSWRLYKLAFYAKSISDIYTKMGHSDDAAAAYAQAQTQVQNALASADINPHTRALLSQISDQPPDRRCGNESQYKSIDSVERTNITFENARQSPTRLYWLDYTGQRKLMATLQQGVSTNLSTFMTHPWVITDTADQCVAIFRPEEWQTKFVIH